MPSLNEIARLCESAPSRFTPQSQLLIQQILNSLVDDPHPAWKINELNTQVATQGLMTSFPALLTEISKHPTVRDSLVTTFDVLHWLSAVSGKMTKINLDRWCPYDK
jgi:hypothetical protein